jgi:indolepyruvate ferredoxin oxidoreductase beta subunit
VLIAALGGEGGGVLADWIVAAASARDFVVQSTSIPGVAQRTGATTYYVELYPASASALDGRAPVLALTPLPGDVDVMLASELLEAGRAVQNGYVTPDRTTLIASTHRIYTVGEKTHMGEGRFASDRVLEAARLARRAILFDMQEAANREGTLVNAILFGALLGSGVLPLTRADGEAAIRQIGKGVEASLRGFALGFERATRPDSPAAELVRRLPADARAVLEAGAARCRDYQDPAYEQLYLERVRAIEALDPEPERQLTRETARFLALWMCYEDVIRVADLKTRGQRLARVREQVGAKAGEPVRVTEFLKPGVDEVTAVLPAPLARRLRALAQRRGWIDRLNVGLRLRTTSITGFALLRVLAGLRRFRRQTARWHEEQALIERWLAAVRAAAGRSTALALEIAALGRLIKGYGDTHRRGKRNFERIFESLVEGAPELSDAERAARLRAARDAALADPDGRALAAALGTSGPAAPPPPAARPVRPPPRRARREQASRTD